MKVTLLFLLINIFCYSVSANSLSINENILASMVREKNSLIEAGEKEVDSFDAKMGHLTRSFIPSVSLTAGQESFKYVVNNYKDQPYYTAQAELNIYNGGRDQYKNNINEVNLEQAKSVQKITISTQIEHARKSFWKSVYLKKLTLQYEIALELIRTNKKAAIKRIRGGVSTKTDQYEFDIKEVELSQDKQRAQFEFEKEIDHLKILIGANQHQEIILNQELTHDHNWRKLTEHSEDDHNYLLDPQKLEVKKSYLKSRLANRKWLPKLDAYAVWLQNNQRADIDRASENERQQTAFGLRATWKLSNVFSGQAEKTSAQAMSNANQSRFNFQKRELESELHMELRELDLLDSMVHNAEENIIRSKKFFKLMTSEYRRGVKNSGDMLGATEKLIDSEVRMMKIIKDFHLARAHVLAKLGK